MAIDYDKLTAALQKGRWYTGTELETLWKVKPKIRKARIAGLAKQGLLITRGKTANIQYQLSSGKKKIKTIGTTHIDKLIHAASSIGSENAIMKKALEEIKAIVTKALEVRT
jgi:hypothetical protein